MYSTIVQQSFHLRYLGLIFFGSFYFLHIMHVTISLLVVDDWELFIFHDCTRYF